MVDPALWRPRRGECCISVTYLFSQYPQSPRQSLQGSLGTVAPPVPHGEAGRGAGGRGRCPADPSARPRAFQPGSLSSAVRAVSQAETGKRVGRGPGGLDSPQFSLGAKAERRTPESSEADAAPAAPRGAVACWRALSPWSLGSGCEETPPLGVTRRRLRHTYFLPCRSCRRSCRNPRKGEGPAGATPAAASPAARPTATSREPIPGCPKICKNTSIYFIFFVLRQDVYIKLRF